MAVAHGEDSRPARRGSLRFGVGSLAVGVAVLAGVGTFGAHARSSSHFYPCAESPPFTQYFVGASYEGLRPVDNYVCGRPYPGEPIRENKVIYFYGPEDCPDSCAAELEVATHPACDRNLYDYTIDPEGNRPPYKLQRIRGVPAAAFNLGGSPRLELYTGDVTVVLFGSSLDAIKRAAQQLRTAGGSPSVGSGDRLPAPVRGHLSSKLNCGLSLSGFRLGAGDCAAATGKCELTLRFGLPRRAFVEARVARQTATGSFRPDTVDQFDARAGQTTRVQRIARGRYRVTIRGMDRIGRRSPATSAIIDVG